MKTATILLLLIACHAVHAQQPQAPVYSFVGDDVPVVIGRVMGAEPLQGVEGRYRRLIDRAGHQWEEVQVIKSSSTEITFTHRTGAVRISLELMPEIIQRAYNFDPFAKHDPAIAARAAAAREAAIKQMQKTPLKLSLRPLSLVNGGMLCEAWPVIQVKTNKRDFSGNYVMQEGIGSRQVANVIVADLPASALGQQVGIKELYPLPRHPAASYQRYTLDPGRAWDEEQARQAKTP